MNKTLRMIRRSQKGPAPKINMIPSLHASHTPSTKRDAMQCFVKKKTNLNQPILSFMRCRAEGRRRGPVQPGPREDLTVVDRA